ncbi:pentatricopeptide repeat-containing protein At3g12770 [Cryptomeria japonica]|uniref:pentatricopeptide repeat-containing protein At3g12770 n=1 Tax=Cryptomeria japonica TaxID=3369 RepID=UPI0025AB813D|nr:pentatricopeptide repeat-containing protein At3g12770 [Cryptomeria japonica]
MAFYTSKLFQSLTPTLALSSSFESSSKFNNYRKRRISSVLKFSATIEPQISWDCNQSNDKDNCASLLEKCTKIKSLLQGRKLHAHLLVKGLFRDVLLETKLAAMYAMCGSMDDARQLFDKMSERSGFLWNMMIRGYACNGPCEEAINLYNQMQEASIQPDKFTYPFAAKACGVLSDLEKGKEIHYHIVRAGLESDVIVANSLLAMYAKCGCMGYACLLFDKMPEKTVVSWNTMIAGYAHNGYANEALAIFHQMKSKEVKPDKATIVSLLPSCAACGALQEGKDIHGYIIRHRLESDVEVKNSLITMYGKCGSLDAADKVFVNMSSRDAVSWTAMIGGYSQNDHANKALELYRQMQLAGIRTHLPAIVSVLPACAHLALLQQGKSIHAYLIKSSLELDVVVGTALVDMYIKCGDMELAHQMFESMPTRNVVSWNAMIAGYTHNGHANEALIIFHQLQLVGIVPDWATMVSVLPACAHLAALQRAKCIHGYIFRNGFELNVCVGTALIDMYAKCGSISIARCIFDKLPERDVVSWSAMIAGYGMHGHGIDALALFSEMQKTGLRPNCITFTSVLYACSHSGLVDEGCKYFNSMSQDYFITPGLDHYACMVDLLGRAGKLEQAHDLIKNMPLEPNSDVWGALLSACRIHGNIQLGERVANHLFDMEPENTGNYVLLSNIYATAGKWDGVAEVRAKVQERGLRKTLGCSLIEVGSRIHAFSVADNSHPQSDKIYAMLETLAGQMKEAGFIFSKNFVLHDVEDEMKEQMLCSHSEKLAIAFGLINTRPGKPIVITKNLRVCGDCHRATKFISKIVATEIIVRDTSRFHHFKNGLCSCRDYW